MQKGDNVTLYCDVSGAPTPHVSWTHVSTGNKWFSKTVVILDVKVEDLGEYKCEASNPYGNDSRSTFIYFPGKCVIQFWHIPNLRRLAQDVLRINKEFIVYSL